MRFTKWTIHNLIGHPLSEIAHMLWLTKLSDWIHEVTSPKLERRTPIHELLAQFEEECCDFSNTEWVVKASLRYAETMRDSQVRCLLYTLAMNAKDADRNEQIQKG